MLYQNYCFIYIYAKNNKNYNQIVLKSLKIAKRCNNRNKVNKVGKVNNRVKINGLELLRATKIAKSKSNKLRKI